MEFSPVHLEGIIGILASSAIIGLPMLGLTIRFAVKPLLDSYAQAFPSPLRSQAEFDRLERRVKELEQAMAMASLPLPPGPRMIASGRELDVPRTGPRT